MTTRSSLREKLTLPETPPRLWPRFTSPLRSTALTARIGRVLGICFGICFVTGMLSHYQYHPWNWLPEPASPKFAYRVTQGLHVATGIITIPLLLVKLWSVYPKLFQWPFLRSARQALERVSIAVLVGSALVELTTGFMNAMDWYAFPWAFVPVHRFLGYVVIGSILLHVAVKLPDIKYGLSTKLVQGDVLTERPWQDNPDAYSNNDNTHVAPPAPSGISRRGVLAATGTGVGLVAVTNAGQTVTPLRPFGLLAIRDPGKGSQGVPVNRTAAQARIAEAATSPGWRLQVAGGEHPYELTLADIEQLAVHEGDLPIACVEGWSVGVRWRGLRLIDVVHRAGGNADSHLLFRSLEERGSYNHSYLSGPEVAHALLATHINGQRLDLDHGYPIRLIAPNRPGVLNTKWLKAVHIL